MGTQILNERGVEVYPEGPFQDSTIDTKVDAIKCLDETRNAVAALIESPSEKQGEYKDRVIAIMENLNNMVGFVARLKDFSLYPIPETKTLGFWDTVRRGLTS